MTLITQTAGFDLEDELQFFIENCLRILFRNRLQISAIKIVLGDGDETIGKPKFCHLHITSQPVNYSMTQYGNSYEEAILQPKRINVKNARHMKDDWETPNRTTVSMTTNIYI